MNEAHNVIHSAEVDFELQSTTKYSWSGQEFVNWTREYVMEAIDRHASELTGASQVITVPECRIDLQLEDMPDFTVVDHSLLKYVSQRIKAALQKAILQYQADAVSIGKYRAGFVWNFIRSGQVASAYSPGQWELLVASFFDQILAEGPGRTPLLQLLKKEDVFRRFYRLTGEKRIRTLLVEWLPRQELNLTEAVKRLLDVNPDHFLSISAADFYWQIFHHFYQPATLEKILRGIVRQKQKNKHVSLAELKVGIADVELIAGLLDNQLLVPPERELAAPKTEPEQGIPEVLDQGSYVGQAGLVLLAPFLPKFLKEAGYLDTPEKLLKPKKVPILLHYLATGEAAAEEWRLTLPKVLAGLNPGQYCDTALKPGRKLDKHIDDLLRSVIEHWEALKNTSAPGLRETFLVREGKLRFSNGDYYLNIEEQTVDILLSYVPWNYSTVKMDWMDRILFVEWTNSNSV